jgi:hypothetical protein
VDPDQSGPFNMLGKAHAKRMLRVIFSEIL